MEFYCHESRSNLYEHKSELRYAQSIRSIDPYRSNPWSDMDWRNPWTTTAQTLVQRWIHFSCVITRLLMNTVRNDTQGSPSQNLLNLRTNQTWTENTRPTAHAMKRVVYLPQGRKPILGLEYRSTLSDHITKIEETSLLILSSSIDAGCTARVPKSILFHS